MARWSDGFRIAARAGAGDPVGRRGAQRPGDRRAGAGAILRPAAPVVRLPGGHVAPQENHKSYLIRAFATVAAQEHDVVLVLTGGEAQSEDPDPQP